MSPRARYALVGVGLAATLAFAKPNRPPPIQKASDPEL
jgi:hypothetical protein